ncbi:MAG: hypothetical protein QMD17_05310 [Rhodocyclaceae bacterium]|nr:hypothetical protein [Rhodocyclaceae bacterium]
MPYTLVIKQQARKKLQSLAKPDRLRIADKINRLGYNQDDPELDIKKLEGESGWRLRACGWLAGDFRPTGYGEDYRY